MPSASAFGEATPTPSPSPNDVANAVSTTNAIGTASLQVTILTTVDGLDDELVGEGVAVLNSGDADLTWQSSAGTSREVSIDDIGYVQIEPPDGDWITLGEGETVPTLAAGQPLVGLAELAELRNEGAEVIGDVETTRFTGWLPAQSHLEGMGLNDIAARRVLDDPAARIDVTVWVDGLGRIIRIMRTVASTSGVAASSTTELTDIGMPVTISDPTGA